MLNEDIQPGYAPKELVFMGYKTHNLHHSADAAKAFQSTIEKAYNGEIKNMQLVRDALVHTDQYMKLNDMHLEQGKAPDEQELSSWRHAHEQARKDLEGLGEFMHHEDYWHMHGHELEGMEANYTPETAGADMADSYQPQGNALSEEKHRVQVTVSEPDHPMVSKRKQEVQKFIRLTADDKESAVKKAQTHYKKQGYKVHSAEHAGMVSEDVELGEELTDKTIKSGDKVKVARVIADLLGVEGAESMSPEAAVSAGLRKIKNKKMTPEFTSTIKKMVELAQEVGIKIDRSTVPSSVAEGYIAQDIMRFNDFAKLSKINKGIVPAENPRNSVGSAFKEEKPDVTIDLDDANPSDEDDDNKTPAAADLAAQELENQDAKHTTVGHTLDGNASSDQVRRMKVSYKTEDVHSADYKVSPSGRKYRARHIEFANSKMNAEPNRPEEEQQQAPKVKKNEPLLKRLPEQYEGEDLSDAELDKIVNSVDSEDDVLDLYNPDELVLVDKDTGEEINEDAVNEQALTEVLSRIERMKARIRFARTSSKRERRLQVILKTRSSNTKINERARHLAVKLMKQRIIRKPLDQMTTSEKERAEKIIASRKNAINRLAMKLAPRIRKIENERLSHTKVTQ